MRDAVERFIAVNREYAKRNHELMRMKIDRMAESAFAFFRGFFHLFAEDVVTGQVVALPPAIDTPAELDLVGDIHSENYGTYKAADGEIHYDVNDFDETTQGRFASDVCRFAANVVLAAKTQAIPLEAQAEAVLSSLESYCFVIRSGLKKGRFSDLAYSESTPGDCADIMQMIKQVAEVKRTKFISETTDDVGGERRIKRSLQKYYNLSEVETAQVIRLVADLQKQWIDRDLPKRFFDLHDICGRISGIGSMGRHRYVALVSGKGHAEKKNVLLEFKESRPSAYDAARGRTTTASALLARAENVIACQRQSQAAPSPYLGSAVDGAMSFQVREISPHAERIDWKKLKSPNQFIEVMRAHGAILGRIHLRSSMRYQGPVNPLPELDNIERFRQRVLAFALTYADVAWRDWQRFRSALGDLKKVETWVTA
ncbi:MAG: DUF2252 domain-containing protein [Gemmataceae bacterium]|nr:DUF2252 domain-containing protein [Gemmataceae bacterium]